MTQIADLLTSLRAGGGAAPGRRNDADPGDGTSFSDMVLAEEEALKPALPNWTEQAEDPDLQAGETAAHKAADKSERADVQLSEPQVSEPQEYGGGPDGADGIAMAPAAGTATTGDVTYRMPPKAKAPPADKPAPAPVVAPLASKPAKSTTSIAPVEGSNQSTPAPATPQLSHMAGTADSRAAPLVPRSATKFPQATPSTWIREGLNGVPGHPAAEPSPMPTRANMSGTASNNGEAQAMPLGRTAPAGEATGNAAPRDGARPAPPMRALARAAGLPPSAQPPKATAAQHQAPLEQARQVQAPHIHNPQVQAPMQADPAQPGMPPVTAMGISAQRLIPAESRGAFARDRDTDPAVTRVPTAPAEARAYDGRAVRSPLGPQASGPTPGTPLGTGDARAELIATSTAETPFDELPFTASLPGATTASATPAGTLPRMDLSPAVFHSLAEHVRRAPDRPVEIALNPEELGRVRLSIATQDGGVTLAIVAERPETLDLMRRHVETLNRDLVAMGFDSVDLSFAADPGGRDTGEDSADAQADDGTAGPAGAPQQNAEDTPAPTRIHLATHGTTALDLRI